MITDGGYMPSTNLIKSAWVSYARSLLNRADRDELAEAEFYRWFDAVARKAKAEVLREFAENYRARYRGGWVLTSHAADLADETAREIEEAGE